MRMKTRGSAGGGVKGCKRAALFSSLVSLIHASTQLFPLSLTTPYKTVLSRPDGFTITNRADRYFVAGMLTAVLDWRPVAYLYGMAALAGSDYARRSAHKKGYVRGAACYAFNLGLAAICLAHMGIIIIPMGSLANRSILPLIPTPTGQRLTEVWKEHVDPFRVSNSYGLFRRMTGVGASEGRGYGGLPPSMVEVPAVVLEGSINGSVWEEIPFRYAPFVEERAPRRTAPHQPRLDWQLWFAALGHYQHNPWLLHLMYRITTRIPSNDAALQLLDVDAYPFREKPPAFVRAWLYHYDFTRAPSRWARSIPGTELCGSDCTKYWKTNADQGVRAQGRLDAAANAGRRAPAVARRSCGSCVLLRRTACGAFGFTYGDTFVDGPLLCILAAVLLPALRAQLPERRASRKPPDLKAE